MNENRRSFLRAMGLSSGAFFIDPFEGALVPSEKVVNLPQNGLNIYKKRRIETDVAVIGGGMSGICAAIAAARNGARVVLIQNRSRLGGNASSEIRMHISGSSVLKQVWRETGILEEIMLDDAVLNQQNAYPMFDFVMYDKVIAEPNITLLLDTALYDAVADGRKVQSVTAFCSPTEEIYEISAKHFADCTGDGTLAALVGAEYMRGREAESQWDESLGQPVADKVGMGNSLLFMADDFKKPMPFVPPKWARKYEFEDFRYRRIYSLEYGYWWLELAGKYDIVNDGQALRHELLAVLFGVWDYIKNSGNHPEAETWALTWVGMIQGKRESRRIVGDLIMTQRDTQIPQNYPDRVAYGGWPLDDHPPEGMDDTSIRPNRAIHLKGPYSIPLRTLYSKDFNNLWMAGRNISVSHAALSSTRVMATCATLGQAIGTAMSYSLRRNKSGREIVNSGQDMEALQQLLLRQDQAILNVANQDKKDLARQASVKASAEEPGHEAESVLDGINRDIKDGKSHQWRAGVQVGSEPWISLKWKAPVKISQVEFTFDTGLNRFLRISGAKSVMDDQVRGVQPETVSDFKIEGFLGDKVVYSDFVTNNYYRKYVHRFGQVTLDSLRVTVSRTHGDKSARIFEIRCYDRE